VIEILGSQNENYITIEVEVSDKGETIKDSFEWDIMNAENK